MFRIFLVVTVVFTSFIQPIRGDDAVLKSYTCEIIQNVHESHLKQLNNHKYFLNTTLCILEGLNVTSSDKHFLVVAYFPIEQIDAVWIRESRLEVLTDDICRTLPFLKLFIAHRQGVAIVEENAFKPCAKMEIVDLYHNSLTTLPPGIFHWNPELTKVKFGQNDITSIDENLFENNPNLTHVLFTFNRLNFLPRNLFRNNPKLARLDFSDNELRELSFLEELPVMRSVTFIGLNGNKLSDLNVEKLSEKFPNLKRIWFEDNQIWCERKERIHDFLNATNIRFSAAGDCIRDKKEWEMTKNGNQVVT